MAITLANPTILVNNLSTPIVANSFSYTEGKGEQTVRVQSAGGGSVQTVLSNNVETNLSMVKFSMFPTAENIATILSWKNNGNANVISASGAGLTRSFTNATLINDYEINLGSDTQIDLEFKTDAAI
jgi:hypothetical protein